MVPGLIAAIAAQLVMGESSISPYQLTGRSDGPTADAASTDDARPDDRDAPGSPAVPGPTLLIFLRPRRATKMGGNHFGGG